MRTVPVARALAALAVIAGGVAILPGSLAGASPTTEDHLTLRANVRNAAGTFLGTVTIQQTSNTRLTVSGQLSGLTPGFHGFHIHAVGICDPAVGPFTSAGPHLNPGGTGHGTHAGDLPSLLVGRNGVTRQSIQTDAVTLAQILDADGGAIIVHAAPDNFAHIPTRYVSPDGPATGGPDAATLGTGDAGARFGCGVITQ